MPKTSPKTDSSPASKAAKLASLLSIEDVRCTGFSANASGAKAAWDGMAPAAEIRLRFGFTAPIITQSSDKVTVSLSFVFTVLAHDGPDGPSNTLISMRITNALDYAKKDGVGELAVSELTDFAHINAPFNAWGFWREFVQSSLARLGYPPFTLPLFRIQNAREYLLEEDLPEGKAH